MMITFSGASDDLVEVGIPGAKNGGEEYNVYPNSKDSGHAGIWMVGDSLVVQAFYLKPGIWGFTATPRDEGVAIPYAVTVTNSDLNGYSAQLNIDAPEGTGVVQLHD